MSASEKLKALDTALPALNGVEEPRVSALRSVLPQIVAVVEAAERSRERMDGALPYDDDDETTSEPM